MGTQGMEKMIALTLFYPLCIRWRSTLNRQTCVWQIMRGLYCLQSKSYKSSLEANLDDKIGTLFVEVQGIDKNRMFLILLSRCLMIEYLQKRSIACYNICSLCNEVAKAGQKRGRHQSRKSRPKILCHITSWILWKVRSCITQACSAADYGDQEYLKQNIQLGKSCAEMQIEELSVLHD